MRQRRRRRLVLGLVLVALGTWFYLMELGYLREFGGELVLTVLGALFLIAYLSFDNYGFLVPGGILLGLGGGLALEEQLAPVGDGALLGLATGFLVIFLVPLARGRRGSWWPIIPSVVLFILAVPALRDLFDLLAENWQLILVLVGLVLVAMALLGGGGAGRGSRETPPSPPRPPEEE